MIRRPTLWIVVSANLVALVALAFIFPHLMISPGPLVKGHEALATDCFACHAAWRGASAPRCIACHAVDDIGLKTTQGVPIPSRSVKVSFHQALLEQDCTACHSDHQGPKLTKRSRKPFSHALLQVSTRDRCSSCHVPPKDPMHRDLKAECGQCHQNTAWKPATLDHDKFFVLDRDHQTECVTCHKNNDHSRYTCYGCHEHSEAKVRREHLEEGIQNFQNCVECHRDPGVEPEKPGRRGEHEKRRKERDRD